MTGGRIKRLQSIIGQETFMLTYGDGVSNPNLKNLLKFHKKNKNIASLTAVRPPARFGAIKISRNKVTYFKEKSHLDTGWINGGFFVMEPEFINFIEHDNVMLERQPLDKATYEKELYAYKHEGFWQCMDTRRDHHLLETLWNENNTPWKK